MNINKFFKWLLGFSLLGFCISPLAGVITVVAVLVLWGISLLVIGTIYSGYKEHSISNSRNKYSDFYIKDTDVIIPIVGNGNQETALGNFVMKETWHLPVRIDYMTKEIDALLTTKHVIFVFLVDEKGFKSVNWDKVRKTIETQLSSSDEAFFAVVINSGKGLIYRYLSKESHILHDIEITNEDLKFLRQK